MTRRSWELRPVRSGDWEFVVGGKVAGFVSLQAGVERPNVLARRLLETVVRHHGDRIGSEPADEIDWNALGWSSAADHDAILADLDAVIAGWRGHPLERRCLMHVVAAKQSAGLPSCPPYSLEELDELDGIIRTAPEIVAQDVAAEERPVA